MAISKDTSLLLANGQITIVNQLKIGDALMGYDSRPRKIIHLENSEGTPFKIIPNKGTAFETDGEQLLYLLKSEYLNTPYQSKTKKGNSSLKTRYIDHPKYIAVSVDDLFGKGSIKFKRSFLLTKTSVTFEPNFPLIIDPYFLGLWLGDGSKHNISITTMDDEIRREVYYHAEQWALKVSVSQKKFNKAKTYSIVRGNVSGHGRFKNPLLNEFSILNLINNKHIPFAYLMNSEDDRLKLLAGIIDTDGTLQNNYYSVTQKSKILIDQIKQLADGLGFRTQLYEIRKGIKKTNFIGDYFSLSISGRVDRIPVRLTRKQIITISEKYRRTETGYSIIKSQTTNVPMVNVIVDGDGVFQLADGTLIGGHETIRIDFQKRLTKNQIANWDDTYSQLEKFIQNNGRLPKRKSKGEERMLAYWIRDSRISITKGIDSENRVNRLKQLEIHVNPVSLYFEEQLNKLKLFRQENPTRWPGASEEFPQGNELGVWCRRIRTTYNSGKLTQSKIETLQSMGFPFSMLEFKYNYQMEMLKEFRLKFGRDPFQKEQYPQGNQLGTWFYRIKRTS